MMTAQQPKMVYNNERFKVKEYDWDVFAGPAAGDQFKDFSLTDLASDDAVKLSDFRGKWVVLETGSSTCSMYTKNIPDMEGIAADYPDVVFLVIYVREAHPGERLHQHKSFDEKLTAARMLKPRYSEHRRVLVDSHDGDFHRAYGAMPNILYVIRPDGTIHYRCNWATPERLRDALDDRENFHTVENADVKSLKASRGFYTSVRTVWTGGVLALWDFVVVGPAIASRHKKVDAFYAEHGRFNKTPGLFSGPGAAPQQNEQLSRQPGE